MNAFGLCTGVIEAVQQRAAGRPVARVQIGVGVLHRVADETFQEAFRQAAAGTEAEHARIDLRMIPVQAVCRTCGAVMASPELIVGCLTCEGVDIRITAGDELAVESIEYLEFPDEELPLDDREEELYRVRHPRNGHKKIHRRDPALRRDAALRNTARARRNRRYTA